MWYWYFFGILYLIILTWQDYKNNMYVDERKNWFMNGVTISLLSHYYHGLLYTAAAILLAFGITYYIKKFKLIEKGDRQSIRWSYFGFLIIGVIPGILYLVSFAAIYSIQWALRIYVFKDRRPVQGYPVLLLSFLVATFFTVMMTL